MTNKEKEKLVFKTIKEVFKTNNWKFKSYFVFKSVNDFFFDCIFSFNARENQIWIDVGFKPMILDEIFWDIIGMPENKNMPLSFRSNAAFQISTFQILQFNLTLKDPKSPLTEILEILHIVEGKVSEIIKNIKDTHEYLDYISKVDHPDYNSIITDQIYNNLYDKAKQSIAFCRQEKISSRYGFGEYDFYDLAEKYIVKTDKKSGNNGHFKQI